MEALQDSVPEIIEERFAVVTSRSGPLPSPDETAQYERILPGFMDRSLMIAEKEQDLVHQGIKRKQNQEFVDKILSKIIAGTAMYTAIGIGIYFVSRGAEAAGTFAIAFGVLAPVLSKLAGALTGSQEPKSEKR